MANTKKRVLFLVAAFVILAALLCLGMASFANEEPTASIKYHNLSYKSNVSIKYAVEVTGLPEGAGVADVIGVKVRKGDTDYEADYEGQTFINGAEYSVFGFSELSAAEMTVDVYATPYVKISETEVITGKTCKNSVLDYSYKILGKIEGGNEFSPKVRNLILNMLSYGAAVQDYSETNTDRMANADYYQISVVNGMLPDGFGKGLYQEGDSVTLTAAPKPGYIFSCWKNSADEVVGNLLSITVEVGNENAVYTAVFARTDSSIQYELDGGTLPEGNWSKYSPGVAFTLPTPTRSGYVFSGWFTSSDLDINTIISEIPANAEGGYTLYAKWNKVISALDGDGIKANGKETANTGNSFTATDGVLLWNQGADFISSIQVNGNLESAMSGAKKVTLSLTLAKESEKSVTPARFSFKLKKGTADNVTEEKEIKLVWLDESGNVMLGGESEFVIATLTEEYQTFNIVVDFDAKTMIYYDGAGNPKYIYDFASASDDENLTGGEWFSSTYWYALSPSVDGGAALRIKNLSLYEGNSVERTPVTSATLTLEEFAKAKYQALVETQRDYLATLTGTWSPYASVSSTNPSINLFEDYTENLGVLAAEMGETVWSTPGAYPNADHPRLLLTKDNLPLIREMLGESDNATNRKFNEYVNTILENNGTLPPATEQSNGYHNYIEKNLIVIQAKALAYLLYEDDYYGYQAILYMKNFLASLEIKEIASDQSRRYGYVMRTAALVYDWCYNLLDDTDKRQLIAGVENIVCRGENEKNDKIESKFPPYDEGAILGHGCEFQILRDYLSFAVAIYGDNSSWYEYIAGRIYNQFIPVRNYYYSMTGVVHQGTGYAVGRYGNDLYSAWILKVATGVNPYDESLPKAGWGLFNYEFAPGKIFNDGDKTGDWTDQTDAFDSAHIIAYLYGDTDMLAMAEYLMELRGNKSCAISYNDINVVAYVALRGLCELEPSDNSNRYGGMNLIQYNGSPLGQYIVRNSWGDDNAAAVFMRIKERSTGDHEHMDTGTFEIYYKGMLTSDGGCYDNNDHYYTKYYHDATISHNGLIIYDASLWGNTAYEEGYYSGGQRRLVSPGNSLEDWFAQTKFDTATLTGRQHGYSADGSPLYAYIAGDITKAYYSETVEYVGRRMLTVYTGDEEFPMVFFVYDDVESDYASYEKRFLLQITSENEPAISGNTVITENGDGRLVLTSLSDSVSINGVGGRSYDADDNYVCASSSNYLINGEQLIPYSGNSDDGHWGRVEIVSTANAKQATFMNVLYVTDAGNDTEISVIRVTSVNGVDGAIFNEKIAAIFATARDGADNTISCTTSGSDNMSYYVSGLAAGEWKVTVDGVDQGTYTVSAFTKGTYNENTYLQETADTEGGLLTFTAPAGSVVITPAN